MFILGNHTLVDPALRKIIGFDLDSTLIKSSSDQNWQWMDSVLDKLQLLGDYRIVIFTNQRGIELGKLTQENFTKRINEIINQLGFEPTVMVAPNDDKWRKPFPCMWEYFRDTYIDGPVDPKNIIYVGDAAGRDGDFSDSDAKFAYNCGFTFMTPEEYFTGAKQLEFKPAVSGFDLIEYINLHPIGTIAPAQKKEIMVMVGPPACGKSTFVRRYFPNYGYVNQDTVNKGKKGTKIQCIRLAKQLICNGSVIIDNTNPDVATRAEYIHIAQFVGVTVRCIFMKFPTELCQHFNSCRMIMKDVPRIPDIAYAVYCKKLVCPTVSEGFAEILMIDWIDISNDVDNLPVLKMRF